MHSSNTRAPFHVLLPYWLTGSRDITSFSLPSLHKMPVQIFYLTLSSSPQCPTLRYVQSPRLISQKYANYTYVLLSFVLVTVKSNSLYSRPFYQSIILYHSIYNSSYILHIYVSSHITKIHPKLQLLSSQLQSYHHHLVQKEGVGA